MNFIGYRSDALGVTVDLVNGLREAERPELPPVLAREGFTIDVEWGPDRDRAVWSWAQRLAEVFAAPDLDRAAELVNGLLADAEVGPHLTAHDGGPWHLHYSRPGADVVERVRATSAFALAMLLSEYGLDRHGVCAAAGCDRVYADTSRNASRRYCAAGCANRASVAAHRARRRMAAPG